MESSRPSERAEPATVRDTSNWGWLLDLRQRLTPVVELLDRQLVPVLPSLGSESDQRVRLLLRQRDNPRLEAAIRRALASREVELTLVDDMRLAITAVGAGTAGDVMLLLLAERADSGSDEERRQELIRIAHWLSHTIAAHHAAGTFEARRDWVEVSALHRVLNQAIATGSQRDVIRAYAEAIAVWTDIDTRAYVGTLSGRFVLAVALTGAISPAAPAVLESDLIPEEDRALRLSTADVERLGLNGSSGVLLVRVRGTKGAPWVLEHIGSLDARTESRLTMFKDVLQSALETSGEVEASRLVWALMQRLVSEGDVIERITAAANDLSDSLLAAVTVTVRRPDGAVILNVGEPIPAGTETSTRPDALTFRLAAPAGHEAALVLRRPGEHTFTQREQRLGEVAASLLGSWLAGVLRGGALPGDRRAMRRSFDQLITGGIGLPAQEDLSLMIIRSDLTDTHQERLQLWVGEIRRRLRPFDVAGALTTGEIGVLLRNTSASEARTVVSRLRRSFREDADLAPLGNAAIGVASRGSSIVIDASLVQDARDSAIDEGP